MKQKLPINKDVLKWSRESMGLSIEDVALRLKKEPSIIESWEQGKESPTYTQLENLAYNILKRPMAVFFFPDVPKEDTLETEFRTLPDVIIKKLPPEIIKLYRKSKVFQINLEELYEGYIPTDKSIIKKFSFNNSVNVESFAEKVRAYLGIEQSKQYSWQSFDEALKEWRNAIEQLGVFIFKDAFHNDDYSGFCVYDEKYPIIFINNSMSFSRQIFTIFHELAHILMHKGGIDFRDNNSVFLNDEYSQYEALCNCFANEILVPSKIFNKELLVASEQCIIDLSSKYSVSREVIMRKLLDRNIIDQPFYNKMINKWLEASKSKIVKKSGGNYYYTQISYLGDTYINLVFSKYYQKKISQNHLSEFLNVKVKNLENFEYHVFS